MEIDKDKQAQAMARAQEILVSAEKKREAARVEKGVRSFAEGNFAILENDEIVENLASYILDKYMADEQDLAIKIVEKLGKSLCDGSVAIRERSLMILSVFTEIIMEQDFEEFREILARNLVEWLKIEDKYIAGFETVCGQLQTVIQKMLESGQWHELENLVVILQQISNGDISKSTLIRGMAGKVHENLAEPDILDKLTNVFLDVQDERRQVAEALLLHMGKFSVRFLIEKMIYSNSKEDRLALIGLIPKFGRISVPVLTKCLDEEPAWFVIRNIVLIISKLGDTNLYQVIEPYLTHRDMRVQQQVINCIETLGGRRVQERLIHALTMVNDELKGQLVIQLGQYEGMDIGYAYIGLIDQHHTFASHVQDDLLMKLCVKIKFYPSLKAAACLEELVNERKKRYGEADKILRAASASLQTMQIKLKEDAPPEEDAEDLQAKLEEQLVEEDNGLFSDDEIGQLADGSDLKEPVPPLGAGQENGNGTALPLYSSQEYHLDVWSKIYEQMTTEERDAFFGMLKPVSYVANEKIVNQGDRVTDLYLVDNGFAGITHTDDFNEISLTSLQAGELVGSEGFVRNLVWSVSLMAQTDLQVRVLGQAEFRMFESKYPECARRLNHYCNHYDAIPFLLNVTHDEGHKSLDTPIDIRSHELLRDAAGEVTSYVVSGTLKHVARGGCCLSLPFVHESNVAKVLGRQVSVEVSTKGKAERKCFGVIAGAGAHDGEALDLYLYIKFYNPFESEKFSCNTVEIM
jgi:hypothetical protein